MAPRASQSTDSLNDKKCLKCGSKFKTDFGLRRHIDSKVCDKFKCKKCKNVFQSGYKLERHLLVHDLIKCKKCGEDKIERQLLPDHRRNKCRSLHCRICDIRFSFKSKFDRHVKRHHKHATGETFTSGEVEKESKTKQTRICKKEVRIILTRVDEGVRNGENSDKNQCSTCKKQFKDNRGLEIHSKIHDLITCKNCGEQKIERQLLPIHRREYCPAFFCKQCDRRFWCRSDFDVHLTVHDKHLEVKCKKCNETFATKHILERHIKRRHVNNDNLGGAEKERKTKPTRKRGRKSRINSSGGIGRIYSIVKKNWSKSTDRFTCLVCGTSRDRSAAIIHLGDCHLKLMFGMLKENPTDKVDCIYCSKSVQLKDASMHLTQHLVEMPSKFGRPYRCALCNAKFSNQKHYTIHQELHHEDSYFIASNNPFQCQICDKGFDKRQRKSDHEAVCKEQVCCFCRKHIKIRSYFQAHMMKCRKGPSTAYRGQLNQTMGATETPVSNLWPCGLCTFFSTENSKLITHIRDTHVDMDKDKFFDFARFCESTELKECRLTINGRLPNYRCYLCRKLFFSAAFAKHHVQLCQDGYKVPMD